MAQGGRAAPGPRLHGPLAARREILVGGLRVEYGVFGFPADDILISFLVRFLVFRLHDRTDGAPRDTHVDPRGDLDDQVVLLVDVLDDPVDPAHREDLVASLDALEQPLLLLLPGALWADQQHPQQDEHGENDDQRSHGSSSGPPASLASVSALKAASAPRSIAARARAVSRNTNHRLCRLSRRRPGRAPPLPG